MQYTPENSGVVDLYDNRFGVVICFHVPAWNMRVRLFFMHVQRRLPLPNHQTFTVDTRVHFLDDHVVLLVFVLGDWFLQFAVERPILWLLSPFYDVLHGALLGIRLLTEVVVEK